MPSSGDGPPAAIGAWDFSQAGVGTVTVPSPQQPWCDCGSAGSARFPCSLCHCTPGWGHWAQRQHRSFKDTPPALLSGGCGLQPRPAELGPAPRGTLCGEQAGCQRPREVQDVWSWAF